MEGVFKQNLVMKLKTKFPVDFLEFEGMKNEMDRYGRITFSRFQGVCVTWSAKRQSTVALSTAAVEYMAMAEAC